MPDKQGRILRFAGKVCPFSSVPAPCFFALSVVAGAIPIRGLTYCTGDCAITTMGKSCIRLKKIEEIPYKLFDELTSKISVQDWINIYESNVKR